MPKSSSLIPGAQWLLRSRDGGRNRHAACRAVRAYFCRRAANVYPAYLAPDRPDCVLQHGVVARDHAGYIRLCRVQCHDGGGPTFDLLVLSRVAMGACFLAGMGFYMRHNTLQTQATQMAPEARGAAVLLFACRYAPRFRS